MIEQQGGAMPGGSAVPAPDAALARTAPVTMGRTREGRLRPYERTYLYLSRAFIIFFIVLMIIPVLLVLQASFSGGADFSTVSFLPQHPTLDHYKNLFDLNSVDFLIWLRNSTIVCISAAVLSVLLVTPTGYAFSRFRFKGRKYGVMAMLLIQMFPAQMSFLAFYYLLNKVNLLGHGPLLDTFQGLVLVYLGGGIGFNAWLFKGYIDGLPRDLEESAYVDGATPFQAFWKVVLPLARPMMAVIFIWTLIGNFNEYILASWLLRSTDKVTMAVGLRAFISGNYTQHWTDFAAAAVISSIPLLLIFMIAQKWLVQGLAAGAVKG